MFQYNVNIININISEVKELSSIQPKTDPKLFSV